MLRELGHEIIDERNIGELLPDGTFDILITRGTATQPPA